MRIRTSGLQKAIDTYHPRVVEQPVRTFFERSTILVHKSVTRRTRRITGEARASIKRRIDTAKVPRWGKVFSDLFRMRFLEYGTKPHAFPVTAKFMQYARRRRIDPFVLMNAIARGGTRGRGMFRRTARGTRRKIFRFAIDARKQIAARLRSTRGGALRQVRP